MNYCSPLLRYTRCCICDTDPPHRAHVQLLYTSEGQGKHSKRLYKHVFCIHGNDGCQKFIGIITFTICDRIWENLP